jgi:hypothetical protein
MTNWLAFSAASWSIATSKKVKELELRKPGGGIRHCDQGSRGVAAPDVWRRPIPVRVGDRVHPARRDPGRPTGARVRTVPARRAQRGRTSPSLEAAIALEDRNQVLCVQGEYLAEGVAAFIEKRAPHYEQR